MIGTNYVCYSHSRETAPHIINALELCVSKLTSFLSEGIRKGSLTLRPATIVIIGSRQLKIAPNISIFPSLGSTGRTDKCCPAGWQTRVQGFYHFLK